MSDLKICRICLIIGVKMYDYNQYHLKQFYEEVMGKNMDQSDGLPLQFCYECAAILHKFHKFREKCYIGENVLQKIKWRGPITVSSISLVHRQNKNLQSTLGTIVISKRIRTCIVKHKSASKSKIKQNKQVDEPEIEESDYDSDNSVDDKNVTEIKNDAIDVIKHEVIDTETDTIEEEVNIDIENVNIDEITTTDLEDDRMFTNDEEFNTEFANDVIPETNVKEEIDDMLTIEEEKITSSTQQNNYNIEKDSNKKKKKIKGKRFVNPDPTNNPLEPTHWLKITLSEEEALKEFNARAHNQKYLSAAYHCSDCYKGFSKEDMLNRHIKLRHCKSLGSVECRFCKMRFKMKCHLTKHIIQHYTKYKCLRCDTMCPLLTTALFHNAYHNGVKRQCKYCGQEFRHPSTYYTHLRTHRSEHVCSLCGVSFVSVAGLNIHKKTMHVNTVVNPQEEKKAYCERCDIEFQTPEAYNEHMIHSIKHAEGVEGLAGETPGPSIPKRKRGLKKKRVCTPCTICNVTFPTHAAFLKHRSKKHKGDRIPEERHICEICGASLAINSVSAHLNTHTQEKMFNCPTCQMQFTTKSSMKRHQVTHTGEKPFQCTLCEKRFTQKTGVKLHYRTFHLKEPYPKRNRKKKRDIQQDFGDFLISGENSE